MIGVFMVVGKLNNVIKNYRIGSIEVPALRKVTLTIERGDFLSIAGPSGSGKTTLLNLLGCLNKPTSGQVFIGDSDVSLLSKNQLADFRNLNLGFIFQTFNLIPVLTAFENVEFPLILMKIKDRAEREEKVINILTEVGLKDFIHRRPNELSGGQQQRVAVARALVKSPKIVLADEPTANLDSKTGENLLKLMKQMNEKYNTTFVFSTHDQMVMNYARRLVELHDGQVVSDEKRN